MITYQPGDIVNGHRLNDDGTEWVAVTPTTRVNKRQAIINMTVLFGIPLAIIALIVLLFSSVGSDVPESVKADGDRIAVNCFSLINPVNYPRISDSEESRLTACVLRAVDTTDPVRSYILSEYGF